MRRIAIGIVPLVVSGMIYYAINDLSVPISSRRPGGSHPITWANNPIGFVAGFAVVYGAMFCVALFAVPVVVAIVNAVRRRIKRR